MKLAGCGLCVVSVILISPTDLFAKNQRSIIVDCNVPQQSVQAAIDGAAPGVGTTIFVTGQCSEDVTIAKDAITLNGDPNQVGAQGGDGTVRTISVLGADNVSIEFLTVDGSTYVVDTANVKITNSSLDGGILLYRSSVVRLNCNNSINAEPAIVVEEGAALREAECAASDRDEITGPITSFNGSTIDLRGADVTGPIVVNGNATFRAQLSGIIGNIKNGANSLVGFRSTATFTGTLACDSTSGVFGTQFGLNAVQCGDTCAGDVPTSCGP